MSSSEPLGRSPLQPFIPEPYSPSSHENETHTCCPKVYIAPSTGEESVIVGGVRSAIVYVTD